MFEKAILYTFFTVFITGIFMSCSDPVYLPKPKGYPRIDLPGHEYKDLQGEYPYTFQYSKHSKVIPDSTFMTEPYWIEIVYPEHEATLNITYKSVKDNLDSLIEITDNSQRLTSKHYVKAVKIDDYFVRTPKGYPGVVFELEGEVPSPFQFYVTDSANHFLRATLYFPHSDKNDSLKPVIDYIKLDMMHMLNTVDWKKL